MVPESRPRSQIRRRAIDDIALRLQIDLLRGDNKAFVRRLQRALEDAFRQGSGGKPH